MSVSFVMENFLIQRIPKYVKHKPVDKRPEKQYVLVPCNGCSGQVKVLISKYQDNKDYFCYKCSQRSKESLKKFDLAWHLKHGN